MTERQTEFVLTQKAVDDLLAVREAIAIDDGKTFWMATFASQTACGTTLCIAGHMLTLRGWLMESTTVDQIDDKGINMPCGAARDAMQRLHPMTAFGLEYGYSVDECASYWMRLFDSFGWDHDLMVKYMGGHRVDSAQQAIDRFIAKYGPKKDSKTEDITVQPVVQTTEVSTEV
jgi:hypothetical protein